MAVVELKAKQRFIKRGDKMKEVYIILKGSVRQITRNDEFILENGCIIGMMESDAGSFLCDYVAKEDTILVSYPYRKPEDYKVIFYSQPQYAYAFVHAAIIQCQNLLNRYLKIRQSVRDFYLFCMEKYQDYQTMCTDLGIEQKNFSRIEFFNPMTLKDKINQWEIEYNLSIAQRQPEALRNFYESKPELCIGEILHASKLMCTAVSNMETMIEYLQNNQDILLNEKRADLLELFFDLAKQGAAKGKDIIKHQINGSINNIKRTEIHDKDYIGMSKDTSIAYEIGTIKPGEKKELEIAILIDENKNISDIEDEIERVKRIDFDKEYINTKAYWRKYVKKHNGLKIKEPENSYDERIYEIYKRSILLFPLLTNAETGAIIASPEIDENFTRCGRYAYCWPRDAVFMTKAMDILKMNKETEKFYKVFCQKTQSKNGMWEQRFYTDGKLAPCWGYQIDETASVVFGVYEHYKYTNSEKFLKENLQMCEKATDFLKRYIKDWVEPAFKSE